MFLYGLGGFFSTFTLITDGAMNADVLDYQQYKTGERLEGLMSQFVGIIGTFVSMGVTYLIQTIIMQNHYGLVNNYDDLYNVSFREPLSKGMIALAAVGYVISLIPFITMYTLTEEEHEAQFPFLKSGRHSRIMRQNACRRVSLKKPKIFMPMQ